MIATCTICSTMKEVQPFRFISGPGYICAECLESDDNCVGCGS